MQNVLIYKVMKYDKQARTITISQNTGITVSFALLIMFAGAIFTIATWVGDTRHNTTQNTTDISSLKADVVKLQGSDTETKVKLTEIQTQLKSIDTSLLEIKERL